MRLIFNIHHQVCFGQSICICGSLPELGAGVEAQAQPMTCLGTSEWKLELETSLSGGFEYFYLIKDIDGSLRKEWGPARRIAPEGEQHLVLQDFWRDMPSQSFLYTSAFTGSFLAHTPVKPKKSNAANIISIRVDCPFVEKGQRVLLCGEADFMGNWQAEKALSLDYIGGTYWQTSFPASKLKGPTPYKLAIADEATATLLHWEECDNRELKPLQLAGEGKTRSVLSLRYVRHNFNWKAAGVAIPVFSLRSTKSAGCGDFSDLKLLVDWAVRTGQKVIQILPVNDTTTKRQWTESYPYNSISIYALHPLYFALSAHPLANKKLHEKFIRKAEELNALESVDYEATLALKEEYILALFAETGADVLSTKDFKAFFSKNEHWLFSYAVFSLLRDRNGSADFATWKAFNTYDRKQLEAFVSTDEQAAEALRRVYFTQYLLHLQLLDATTYARSKGVILKGDIPIGISRASVEAWVEPHLFNLDVQTGAPPDAFSVSGQNWGFPTYNWEAMAAKGYDWWINRFRKMADYFDAYRIDHILGFFRIWEIPEHSVQGLLGYFSPALPFTVDEIRASGLHFDAHRMTRPFIHEYFLSDIFGEYRDEVIANYLQSIDWQRFELKEFCNTQQKIKKHFSGKDDAKTQTIRDGLYALCNEVLFVRDKREAEKFHPRISAQFTYSYRSLNDHEKEAFNALYDDFFYRRHNDFWYVQAMRKLPPLISSTSMLVCGEDLGMIPACVAQVMRELQILSLEIQRMPKQTHRLFEDLSLLPYLSVCTTSTHDMSPMRAWWEENPENSQRYYNEVLWKQGQAPEACSPALCEQILRSHLASPAMLTIIPWQDWISVSKELRRSNPQEERINIPAVAQHYWRYRMHLSLENLLEQHELNRKIRTLIEETQS